MAVPARLEIPWGAIKCVTHQRVMKRSKVHSDLVCSSGIDLDLQQGEPSVLRSDAPGHEIVSDRLAAAMATSTHACSSHWIAADWTTDSTPILLHKAMYQGNVSLLCRSIGKLCGQAAVRGIVLGHHQQAAGFPIQAMDDAGP